MKKTLIFLLFLMLTFPILNQEQDDKEKDKTKLGDVFDRRIEDDNSPYSEDEMLMYKEVNKLTPLTKKEKVVWAFRTSADHPFI